MAKVYLAAHFEPCEGLDFLIGVFYDVEQAKEAAKIWFETRTPQQIIKGQNWGGWSEWKNGFLWEPYKYISMELEHDEFQIIEMEMGK